MDYSIDANSKNRVNAHHRHAPRGSTAPREQEKAEMPAHETREHETRDRIEFSDRARERVADGEEIEYTASAITDEVMSLGADKAELKEQAEKLRNALSGGLNEFLKREGLGAYKPKASPEAIVDPDGSIYSRVYISTYVGRLQQAVEHIESYYADANAENSKMSKTDFLGHMWMKYINEDSPIFRSDMSAKERETAMYQEKALYFGTGVTLSDKYALAAHGGLINSLELDKSARQAAADYIAKLVKEQSAGKAGQ